MFGPSRNGFERGVLALIALGACGRIGFDETSAPRYDSVFVASASAEGDVFTAVSGATLTFTPKNASERWLVLVSGELRSSSAAGEEFTVEARYLINGAELGYGGTTNIDAETFGPWQHFALVSGVVGPQTITVEIRDVTAMTSTIENLRVIAWPLPSALEAHYTSADPIQEHGFTEPTEVHSFDFSSNGGDYLIMVVNNATEREAGAGQSVGAQTSWLLPDGSLLADADNPRKSWQSNFSARRVTLSAGSVSIPLRMSVNSGTSQVRYIRALALRLLDDFRVTTNDTDVTREIGADPEVLASVELDAGRGPHLLLTSAIVRNDCPELAARKVSAIDRGESLGTISHSASNCTLAAGYGWFAVSDKGAGRVEMIAAGAADGLIRVLEAGVHAIEL